MTASDLALETACGIESASSALCPRVWFFAESAVEPFELVAEGRSTSDRSTSPARAHVAALEFVSLPPAGFGGLRELFVGAALAHGFTSDLRPPGGRPRAGALGVFPLSRPVLRAPRRHAPLLLRGLAAGARPLPTQAPNTAPPPREATRSRTCPGPTLARTPLESGMP